MSDDVRSLIREVDRANVPDLWDDITSRTPAAVPSDPRPARRAVAAAVAIVVAAAAFAFAYEGLHHATAPGTETPSPSVELSPSPPLTGDPRITAEIPLPHGSIGSGVSVGAGSVWVGIGPYSGDGRGELLRIDPASNEIVARIAVEQSPARKRIVATDNAVWVASPGLLERIDPATNAVVARVQIPDRGISALTADANDVWAITIAGVSDDGARGVASLVRIDQATDEIVADIPLGSQLTGYEDEVHLGARSVWVIGVRWIERENAEYGSDLIRVDPSTNAIVARVPVGGFNAVITDDEVWVRFPADGVFDESGERWLWTKVDVGTNEPSQPFDLPTAGLKIVTPEALWSVDYDEQENVRVTRYDPRTLQVEARSEAIRSYFTDAVLDPASGTVWISAVQGIVRVDIAQTR